MSDNTAIAPDAPATVQENVQPADAPATQVTPSDAPATTGTPAQRIDPADAGLAALDQIFGEQQPEEDETAERRVADNIQSDPSSESSDEAPPVLHLDESGQLAEASPVEPPVLEMFSRAQAHMLELFEQGDLTHERLQEKLQGFEKLVTRTVSEASAFQERAAGFDDIVNRVATSPESAADYIRELIGLSRQAHGDKFDAVFEPAPTKPKSQTQSYEDDDDTFDFDELTSGMKTPPPAARAAESEPDTDAMLATLFERDPALKAAYEQQKRAQEDQALQPIRKTVQENYAVLSKMIATQVPGVEVSEDEFVHALAGYIGNVTPDILADLVISKYPSKVRARTQRPSTTAQPPTPTIGTANNTNARIPLPKSADDVLAWMEENRIG